MALTATIPAAAQQPQGKLLTMEETILSRELSPASYPVRWVAQSDSYSITDGTAIVAVNARSGKRSTVITLEELNRLLSADFKAFPAYSFEDENTLVVISNGVRSTIDLRRSSIVASSRVPEGVANLTCQPGKGGRYAYTRANNLYYFDGENEHAVTEYEDRSIVCGQSVSRNEFGITGGIFFAPDASKIAFYRKDESRVTDFPLVDITTRTGTLRNIKYPMNGMASERVDLGIYDIATARTVYLTVTDFDEERYLTNVTWAPDAKHIYVQVLDRRQKNMHLNMYDVTTGRLVKQLLTEHNDRFVEPQYPLVFLRNDPSRFIYTTDNRDGYYNLYLCDHEGNVKRLTATDADVRYVAQNGRYVYYTSAEVSPVENHLFKVDIVTGRSTRLTPDEGWHNVSVSHSGRYFLDDYSSLRVPRIVEMRSTENRLSRELFCAPDPTEGYAYADIELGTVKSADGKYDNYYRLIKPLGFDPAKKYPAILYVYGGPHSQMVRNSYQAQLRRWEMYMAQRGYVVFVMDNRGTSNRGAEYEKAIHKQCGQCEMQDQMAGMKWLMSHPWVDRDRIGVHGWSYGGYMTISLMTNYPDVFKVGVAGGPVIDWKWYEVMYGERYMETPETNAEGFEKVSLLNRAADLKGKLLICQGAMDGTVVWQHSLNFVRKCIESNVQVDYFPYPLAEHNVFGKDAVHLHNKISDYFEQYLKPLPNGKDGAQ